MGYGCEFDRYVCIMLDLEAQKNVKKVRYADQDADYTGSFLKTSYLVSDRALTRYLYFL